MQSYRASYCEFDEKLMETEPTTCSQGFIQAVLLKSVFEQRLSFQMLKKCRMGSRDTVVSPGGGSGE